MWSQLCQSHVTCYLQEVTWHSPPLQLGSWCHFSQGFSNWNSMLNVSVSVKHGQQRALVSCVHRLWVIHILLWKDVRNTQERNGCGDEKYVHPPSSSSREVECHISGLCQCSSFPGLSKPSPDLPVRKQETKFSVVTPVSVIFFTKQLWVEPFCSDTRRSAHTERRETNSYRRNTIINRDFNSLRTEPEEYKFYE